MKVYIIHMKDANWRLVVSTIELAEAWADHFNRQNPLSVRATIEPVSVIEIGPPGKGVMGDV
jgi:hypothetical protein